MKNSTYPMQMNRFVGVLRQTRIEEINHGNVSLDELCSAVIASLTDFFERPKPLTYEELKQGYMRLREELAKNKDLITLERFAAMLAGDGIEGFAYVIPLALAWGLDPYIKDWKEHHLNEWLDHPSGPGTLD